MFKTKAKRERDDLLQRIADVQQFMSDEIAYHHELAGKHLNTKTAAVGTAHIGFTICLETLIDMLDGKKECVDDCGCDKCTCEGLVVD